MLSEFKLFQALTKEQLAKLGSYFKKSFFNKKEQIAFPDSRMDYIYLVRTGRVKVSYLSPDGKEITVTILHPGDIYSLHSEANSTVLEAAEILYISADDFKTIISENPELTLNIIKILGTILKNTNDALLNLAFKEVNSRLASQLLKMAREEGIPDQEGIVLKMGLTHEELATLINSTRQTVTTILNRFEKDKLIRLDKKKLIITNLEELERISL